MTLVLHRTKDSRPQKPVEYSNPESSAKDFGCAIVYIYIIHKGQKVRLLLSIHSSILCHSWVTFYIFMGT